MTENEIAREALKSAKRTLELLLELEQVDGEEMVAMALVVLLEEWVDEE